MPMWRKGRNVWTKICLRCGREFVKRKGFRQSFCEDCSEERKSYNHKRYGKHPTIIERMMNEI